MNDRIRELFIKVLNESDNMRWNIEDAEKFAELIIRECMTVADLPCSADGKYDSFLPSEMISKHFGVK